MKVIVIGGGFAGCGAAATAARAGAEVHLYECSDTLGGIGRNSGSTKLNGQISLHYEALSMGGSDILGIIDEETIFEDVILPGQYNVSLFDVNKTEVKMKKCLEELGVKVVTCARVKDVQMNGSKIDSITLSDKTIIQGDAFIDATGNAGPMGICTKYGNGCSMCNLRCPTFGGRVSIAAKAGIEEKIGKRPDGGTGAMAIAVSLEMDSISEELQNVLKEKGFAVLELPKNLRDANKVFKLAVHIDHLVDKIVLTNIGCYARMLTGVAPLSLDTLRSIPGFEYAVMANPIAGGNGNNVRYVAITPFNPTLQAEGVDNLFIAGDKCGIMGVTEAVTSGNLAGYNASLIAAGKESITLPTKTILGDMISYAYNYHWVEKNPSMHVSCNKGPFLEKMKKEGTYTLDSSEIDNWVQQEGLKNIFSKKVN